MKISTEECVSSIPSDLGLLVPNQKTDCILLAGDKEWKVHKSILKKHSSILISNTHNPQRVILHDMNSEVAEELLRFLYTNSVLHLDIHCKTLLRISDYYEIKTLKMYCEQYLINCITPVNVSEMLLLSDIFECPLLKKAALNYCRVYYSYIIKVRYNPLHYLNRIWFI